MYGLPPQATRWDALAAMLTAGMLAVLVAAPVAPAGSRPASRLAHPAGGGVGITLASAGNNGAGGTLPSGAAAVAGSGRYVAFQSDSALPADMSVPQLPVPRVPGPAPGNAPPSPGGSGAVLRSPGPVPRVYVRDLIGRSTALVSDANLGGAVAPDISADGEIVSYDFGTGGADDVYVASAAPAAVADAARRAFRVQQVSGTTADLPGEHIPACPARPSAAAAQTAPCGPKLSADGTTLVYAAAQTALSPALLPTWQGQPLPGDLLDFVPAGTFQASPAETVTFTVGGVRPVTFDSPGVSATWPFSVQSSQCTGTLEPGANCQVTVAFQAGPVCGADSPRFVSGTLSTAAATPAGQTTVQLAAFCAIPASALGGQPGQRRRTAGAPALASTNAIHLAGSVAHGRAAACPVVTAGIPFSPAPAPAADNQVAPLISLGDVDVGRPRVVWATYSPAEDSGPAGGAFNFSSSDCGAQLIDPGTRAVAGQPAPCRDGEALGGPSGPPSCTAYFLIEPASVTTSAAVFGVPSLPGPGAGYLTVSGIRRLVIARHDPSGQGDFAASPNVVVSVDGSGTAMPAASQPSVSATGRYAAFTAPVPAGDAGAQTGGGTEVWRHDTDARGDRSYRPGGTVLVSCLAGRGRCQRAASAASPSLSGDGQAVAFTAAGQVEIRDIRASQTVTASAGPGGAPGNAPSSAPALSTDASTVAYLSEATNLAAGPQPLPGVRRLYARQLLGPAGGNELIEPTAAGAPGATGAGLPAVDAHGRLVTFQTADRLTAAAVPGVQNVYTAERFPLLAATPASLPFGTVLPGSRAATRTAVIANSGPGPATVTGVSTRGPFAVRDQTCLGTVLHAGAACAATVSFTPGRPGRWAGALVVTTADDGEPPAGLTVPAAATVATPTLVLSPAAGLPGQVTQVSGTGFPADVTLTLGWRPGLGAAAARTDAAGRFRAAMLIFPGDITGPRTLVAELAGKTEASAPFLADRPPAEPPFTTPPG